MTTNEQLTITLSERDVVGKKVRELRRLGVAPAHYYGRGAQSLSLQADVATLRKVVQEAGANIPVRVSVEGKIDGEICFVREVQWHPVNGSLLHVDFMRLDVTERVTAEVPVVTIGQSQAVRDLGGVLIQPFQTLLVEALPLDMPKEITVDITPLLEFGDSIRIGEVELPEGVDIMRNAVDMLVSVQEPRIEVEEEEEEIEGELEGDEEAAEGEEGEESDAE